MIPKEAGFYWAKWRIADDGTPEGDEQTPSDDWEVVDVFENCLDPDDDEYLMVHVPGQAKAQSIENFFWGTGPLEEPPYALTFAKRRGLIDALAGLCGLIELVECRDDMPAAVRAALKDNHRRIAALAALKANGAESEIIF